LSLGNDKETLELRCGEFLIDTFSWNFPIPSGYILRREMLDYAPRIITVLNTVDGDTIDVMLDSKKTRIRLLGVDTPETVHPMKSVEKFGKEASDFTRATLMGKTVWMTFDNEMLDHYGRTL
jgi:micrococcal nuclease